MADWRIHLAGSNRVCRIYERNGRIVYLWGELHSIPLEKDGKSELSEDAILDAIADGTYDYNELHDFFKLIVEDKKNGTILLVGDNAGSQFFFIDRKTHNVSDSLLTLVDLRNGDYAPNYESISRFMRESRVYTDETVVEDILTTNKDCYYILHDGEMEKNSKALTPFHERTTRASLKQVVESTLSNAKNDKVSSVMTGGIDSRTILACLLSAGLKPDGIISGRNGNPDVGIAQKLSKKMELNLAIYNPDDRSKDWIRQGFEFSDGIYDTALSYRHVRLKNMACDSGKYYIFGGVGGEFYKNSFCLFLRRCYFVHSVTASTLASDIFINISSTPVWYGEKLREGKNREQEKVRKIADGFTKGNMLCKCNSAGYLKLTKGMSCLTNNYARYCLKVDPLMDRDVVAGVSNDSALKHIMAIWQRKNIEDNCPSIATIKTDQGLTCSANLTFLIKDSLIVLGKNIHLALRKLSRKKNAGFGYWDDDYSEISKSNEYKEAFIICRKLDIVSAENQSEIPLLYRGRVVTLGLLFSKMNSISSSVNNDYVN